MKFEKIKLDEWKRAKLFHTYMNDLKIVMSMTAEIDVAPLLSFIRENGLKFLAVSHMLEKRMQGGAAWDF